MKYKLLLLIFSMIAAVVASNLLVEVVINSWLTLGAFTYPVTFLINELTNFYYGPRCARRLIYFAFVVAFLLSLYLADFQIACASGLAFLISQLLDIYIFSKLRAKTWYWAPALAAIGASLIDTAVFFSLAFWGQGFLIITLGLGDVAVKIAIDILLLMPFRFFVLGTRPRLA